MNGRPVWLASLSLRTYSGALRPAMQWNKADIKKARKILTHTLRGVGDPAYERYFLMPITGCVQRALQPAEILGLPEWWQTAAVVHMAGGPLRIIDETIQGSRSTQPCAAPRWQHLEGDAWLANDCQHCASCEARLKGAACQAPLPR